MIAIIQTTSDRLLTVFRLMTDFRQTSDRLQTSESYFRLWTSARLRTSDFVFWTSDFEFHTSDLRLRTDFELQTVSIVGSLRDREVACLASDRQGSNFESCVISIISPSSGGSPGPVYPICAQRWPKARFILFHFISDFEL